MFTASHIITLKENQESRCLMLTRVETVFWSFCSLPTQEILSQRNSLREYMITFLKSRIQSSQSLRIFHGLRDQVKHYLTGRKYRTAVTRAVMANPTKVRKGVALKLKAFWILSNWLAIQPRLSLNILVDLRKCIKQVQPGLLALSLASA